MAPMSGELPLGFRFAPTDEEKLFCLDYKNGGLAEKHNVIIPEVDICKCEPRDLAQENLLTGRDGDLYFFSKRKRKHPHRANTIERANQIERSTREGYWKDAGKDQDIKSSDESLRGTRKSLSFYTRSPRHPSPTEWRMEEYVLGRKGSASASNLQDYALYRVFKSNKVRKNADVPRLNPKADHNESSIKPLEVLSGEQTHSSQENNYIRHPSCQPLEVADSLLPDTNNSNGNWETEELSSWETDEELSSWETDEGFSSLLYFFENSSEYSFENSFENSWETGTEELYFFLRILGKLELRSYIPGKLELRSSLDVSHYLS